MSITFPSDPLVAVTHPDPYPYYAHLVAHHAIYRDETLGLWVASSADAVSAVLTSALCRVRPLEEPVPSMLLGSPAAAIFQQLVRMNDGELHCPFKLAVEATMQSIDASSVVEQCSKWTSFLLSGSQAQPVSRRLQVFAFHLSVYVLASLLGVPQDSLHYTALWMSDFVRCLAPASSTEQIERGKVAAGHLFDLFHSLLNTYQTQAASNLLTALQEQAKHVGCTDSNVIVANGIGFLSQAYEATAGLIDNTIVALASQRHVYEQVRADPNLLRYVIQEVLRYDPPIQNTRRFLAQNGCIAGQEMQAGDAVLVVLAAANRDPAANLHPERFESSRQDRCMFTFGTGPHVCPGETLAVLIAQAGIEHLMLSGFDFEKIAKTVIYRPSVNARIALFAREHAA